MELAGDACAPPARLLDRTSRGGTPPAPQPGGGGGPGEALEHRRGSPDHLAATTEGVRRGSGG
eukprot:8078927-Pyramimonas_sp.AAC.1